MPTALRYRQSILWLLVIVVVLIVAFFITPQHAIGTDPGQGNVLVQRTVNTTGTNNVPPNEATPSVGFNSYFCTPVPRGNKDKGRQQATFDVRY